MAQSISAILEETLLLDSSDGNTQGIGGNTNQVSTSRLLLDELKRKRETQNDVIKVAKTKEGPIDPLVALIGESKDDIGAPTYWKYPQNHSDKGKSKLSESTLAKKAKEELSANKGIQLPAGHKQKQQKKSKGEAYSDRLSSRLSSNQHRKHRLDSYSKIY